MPEKLTHSEQSRINGSKSKGPTSLEGKAKSSANALKHGFAAVINVALHMEDKAAFEQHVAQFRASFSTRTYAEQSLVDQLAAIQWRQSRLVTIETALLDAQIGIQQDTLKEMYPISCDDQAFRLVKAWQALSHQPPKPGPDAEPYDPTVPTDGYDVTSLELVRRYQVSLDRQFRNTLLSLRQLQKDFTPAGGAAVIPAKPNEPGNPTPPEPETPPEAPQQQETNPIQPLFPVENASIIAPITPLRLVPPVNKR